MTTTIKENEEHKHHHKHHHHHSKKKRNQRIGIAIIVVLVAVLVVSLVYTMSNSKKSKDDSDTSNYHTVVYKGKTYTFNSSIVSLYLLGVDKTKTDPNRKNEQGQSDAIDMLLMDRKNKTIKVITIPRDCMTSIEEFDGEGNSLGWDTNHLALAYAYGDDEQSGCMRSMRATSKMLSNVPINYYAEMDMDNIAKLQAIVGDLQVTVPNDSLKKKFGWSKGQTVTINESNAESYVRYRDTKINFSPGTRQERQQSYYQAYYEKLTQLLKKDFNGTISKMYALLKNVTTNLSYDTLVDFGNMLLDYSFDNNQYYNIPGKYVSGDEYDEYHINKTKLKEMVLKLYYTQEK
jgi:anionic cell wall polymer biosynthesis LytR-Cps2A-Psr (LCP) family protein